MDPLRGTTRFSHLNRLYSAGRWPLLAVGLLALTFLLGNCSDPPVEKTKGTTSPETARDYADDSEPRAPVFFGTNHAEKRLTVSAFYGEGTPQNVVLIEWSPPDGAGTPTFDVQPTGMRDGTYYWQGNVPVNSEGWANINATFDGPADPGPTGKGVTVATATRTDSGSSSLTGQAIYWKLWGQAPYAIGSQRAVQDAPARPQAEYYLWQMHLLNDWSGFDLTTALCQDAADLFQDGRTFFALRFPDLNSNQTDPDAYPLPLAYRQGITPTLSLARYGPYERFFTLPFEVRAHYMTVLENAMPLPDGEHWLAIGAAGEPAVTCPQGLDVPAGDWEFEANLWLDFGGGQDDCLGCILPLYYCYEGQEPPFLLAQMAAHADLSALQSYQGWGITCLGPQPLPLFDPTPPFLLRPMHQAFISPSVTISLPHILWNTTYTPLTLALTYTSDAGLPWGLYEGDYDNPTYPRVAITQPLTLGTTAETRGRGLWAIVDVPPDAASGPSTLVITATDVSSPALFLWTSDLIWVGEWLPPPSVPEGKRKVYLPIVAKDNP